MRTYRTLRELAGPLPETEQEARLWFSSPAWKLMHQLQTANPKMHELIINRGANVDRRFPQIAAEQRRAAIMASLPEGAKLVEGRVVVPPPEPVAKKAPVNTRLTRQAFERFKDNVALSMLAGQFTNEWRAYRRKKKEDRGHS